MRAWILSRPPSPHWFAAAQGETKVLKLKNLRPQDYASYTCQVSVRNVCGIPDKAITFRLTNTTGKTLHHCNPYRCPYPSLTHRGHSTMEAVPFSPRLPST